MGVSSTRFLPLTCPPCECVLLSMPHLARLRCSCLLLFNLGLVALLHDALSIAVAQMGFEDEPINYSTAEVEDPIAKLQAAIDSGEVELPYDDEHGYLPALLEVLDIPSSSQMLVFSKTSFQLRRINPHRPRALYFNDEVYLGWVQAGEVVEIMSVDPQLGTVFYTLDQEYAERPKFVRDRGQCLICHASSRTNNVPGPLVRSVFPDRGGQPLLGSGTFTINHTSPLSERWGGYYVTGTHGDQRHMGNETAADKSLPAKLDTESGANVTDLSSRINTEPYLQPHSDIVALMVLEHQAHMQSLITRAAYEARSATWYDSVMNEALERPEGYISDTTTRRIDSASDDLVKYLLFCDEAQLTAPIQGTSGFTEEFTSRGPRDSDGRSLREFDLERRMFKYPCSYMIYSDAFIELPPQVLMRIYHTLGEVLSGKNHDPAFDHLSAEDRKAILEILRETKEDLPEEWASHR